MVTGASGHKTLRFIPTLTKNYGKVLQNANSIQSVQKKGPRIFCHKTLKLIPYKKFIANPCKMLIPPTKVHMSCLQEMYCVYFLDHLSLFVIERLLLGILCTCCKTQLHIKLSHQPPLS